MKLRSVVALALAVSVLPIAGVAMEAAQIQVVGINAAVLNVVRIRHQGTPMPFPAVVRQRVALGDEVQTAAKSQLQILLLDKSVFTVGANSRLTIDRFVYDPNRGVGSVAASVAKGAFRFMSGRPHTAGGSSVQTPTATIGIRGTVFEGVVGEAAVRIAIQEKGIGDLHGDLATATLVVLRGPGPATQGQTAPGAIDVTAGGRTVTLDRPMLATYVPYPGATPTAPFAISRAGLQAIQVQLFPALAEQLGFAPPEPAVVDTGEPSPFSTMQPEPRGPRLRPPPGFNPNDSGATPGQGPGGFVPGFPQPGTLQPQGPRPTRTAPQPGPKTTTQTPPPNTTIQGPTPTASPTPSPTLAPPSLKAAPPTLTAAPQPTPTPAPSPSPTPTPKYPNGPN